MRWVVWGVECTHGLCASFTLFTSPQNVRKVGKVDSEEVKYNWLKVWYLA